MMATVPHVTSGLGLRKFQADGFLLTRVYVFEKASLNDQCINTSSHKRSVHIWLRFLQRGHVVYPSNNLPSVLFMLGKKYRTDEDHFFDSKDGDTLLL